MQATRRLACIALVMALAAACDPAAPGRKIVDVVRGSGQSEVAEAPPASSEPDVVAVVFRDDFDDGADGWPLQRGDGMAMTHRDGAYVLTLAGQQQLIPPAPVTSDAAKVVVSVHVAPRTDPHPGSIWGVVCGRDIAGGRYYMAVVQVSEGRGHPLLAGWDDADAEPEVFRRADEPHGAVDVEGVNRLQLTCEHDGDAVALTFRINGTTVATGRDDTPPDGAAWETGMYLDTSPFAPEKEASVVFDRYELGEVW